MPITPHTDLSFINGNAFNRKLYDFLLENRDRILPTDGIDASTVMYEAYCIGNGVMTMELPETHIHDSIKHVETQYAGSATAILATLWAVLSAQVEWSPSLRPVVQILYEELKTDKTFHIWNRFVSATRQNAWLMKPQFPGDTLIVEGNAETAEESLDIARQVRPVSQEKAKSTINQTLIFPNVEQFNNNPAKVINVTQKK